MSANDFDLERAAEAVVAAGTAGPTEMQRAALLGDALLRAEERVLSCEEALAAAKAAHLKLATGDLPDLMAEIGLSMFKLPDGTVFELKEDVVCGISEARRAAAHAWLIENNYGGLIKTVLTAEFGKGEERRAAEVEGMLAEAGVAAQHKESVHNSTLKSFVKERLAAGAELPFDLFGIHPFNKVTYKQPKVKSPRR